MEPRRFGLVDMLLLLVVLAWAAGARVAYVHYLADGGSGPGPFRVQDPSPRLSGLPADLEIRGQKPPRELDSLIQNLTDHSWFGSLAPFAAEEESTAHVSPGYPWLVAMLSRSGGEAAGDRNVRWLQCGLGAATAALYFLFARLAFQNSLVALLAGLLCAIHPFWIANTTQIDDGVVATFLVAAAMYLGTRAVHGWGAFVSLLFGLSLAGLALVRAPLLPFAAAALITLLHRSRDAALGWRGALLATLGFAIGLAPWTVRNARAFHDVLPVSNSAYVHLWMGHNAKATGGPQEEGTMLQALAEARGQEPKETLADLGRLSQRERHNELGRATAAEIAKDPGKLWQRRIWAGLCFFFGEDWFTHQTLAQKGPESSEEMPTILALWHPGIFAGALFAMLLFGSLGWRWTQPWQRTALPSSLAVLWIPLPYILSHAESLSGPRLPLDGVLLTYAAFAIVCLLPGLSGNLWEGPRPMRAS